MDIWWFATGRLCGDVESLADECYWILWFSLPVVCSISQILSFAMGTSKVCETKMGKTVS